MTVHRTGFTPDNHDEFDSLGYLSCRVHQEVEAAVRAVSVEATLIHVLLATAYAKRFGEVSARNAGSPGQSWIDENRVW